MEITKVAIHLIVTNASVVKETSVIAAIQSI